MTVPVFRLLAISLTLATAMPVAPALAGWRDGPYYVEGGWGGDYYAPAPSYRDEYQPDYRYYQGPRAGRQAYAPYYDDPDYVGRDEDFGPPVRPRVMRPPRNVYGVPEQPRRIAPAKPRTAVTIPPAKPKAAALPVAKPVPESKPAAVLEARALPVPRPNLESMDFDAVTPTPAPAAQ